MKQVWSMIKCTQSLSAEVEIASGRVLKLIKLP